MAAAAAAAGRGRRRRRVGHQVLAGWDLCAIGIAQSIRIVNE
jgi:hypothetical protein